MKPKICKWHLCSIKFQPTAPRQEFCTRTCRRKRAAWKAVRGGPLVDMVIAGDVAGIMAVKARLILEVNNGTQL